ncbi:hypothetical protein Q669_21970 [Labrenzia sp. C1B10]|jgi:hypothetical protein|nr:hypothetical protein Q669_21970 [Labrenzia sp. C1B10]ERS01663.1 hypothetical protein Q675_06085 [Labrenzia sp. C1B70]
MAFRAFMTGLQQNAARLANFNSILPRQTAAGEA